jgi:hypothetical protein
MFRFRRALHRFALRPVTQKPLNRIQAEKSNLYHYLVAEDEIFFSAQGNCEFVEVPFTPFYQLKIDVFIQ